MSQMISVEKLSKFYGNYQAVNNISFSINEGETVGILGLNGAGKSTILKMLATFLMPSGGEAFVNGYSTAEHADTVRSNIGFLPDTPPLYNEMKTIDYLYYVARLKDVSEVDLDAYVKDAMDKTSLAEVSDTILGSLSHGFRQRVGIASVLVHKPKVLILDEPINGLDPIQIVEMRDLILSLKEHHTVILSSHILSEITKTCDKILIIDHGKLIAEGTQKELTSGVEAQSKLICEVSKLSEELKKLIEEHAAVKSLSVVNNESFTTLTIEVTADIRSELSKLIVTQNAGLLSLTRVSGGLEDLFMKLIHSSGEALS